MFRGDVKIEYPFESKVRENITEIERRIAYQCELHPMFMEHSVVIQREFRYFWIVHKVKVCSAPGCRVLVRTKDQEERNEIGLAK